MTYFVVELHNLIYVICTCTFRHFVITTYSIVLSRYCETMFD